MRPRPRVAAEASGAILEVPVRSRVIAPVRPTAAAVGTARLLPTVAASAEAAKCPVFAPARRPAAAGIAPLLLTEGDLAVAAFKVAAAVASMAVVVAAVPAAGAGDLTAGAASSPWRRLQCTGQQAGR